MHQIFVEEQFGPLTKSGVGPVAAEEDKKKLLAPKKAAIGFNYEDSTGPPVVSSTSTGTASALASGPVVPAEAMEEDDSDSDIDLGKRHRSS